MTSQNINNIIPSIIFVTLRTENETILKIQQGKYGILWGTKQKVSKNGGLGAEPARKISRIWAVKSDFVLGFFVTFKK